MESKKTYRIYLTDRNKADAIVSTKEEINEIIKTAAVRDGVVVNEYHGRYLDCGYLVSVEADGDIRWRITRY